MFCHPKFSLLPYQYNPTQKRTCQPENPLPYFFHNFFSLFLLFFQCFCVLHRNSGKGQCIDNFFCDSFIHHLNPIVISFLVSMIFSL